MKKAVTKEGSPQFVTALLVSWVITMGSSYGY